MLAQVKHFDLATSDSIVWAWFPRLDTHPCTCLLHRVYQAQFMCHQHECPSHVTYMGATYVSLAQWPITCHRYGCLLHVISRGAFNAVSLVMAPAMISLRLKCLLKYIKGPKPSITCHCLHEIQPSNVIFQDMTSRGYSFHRFHPQLKIGTFLHSCPCSYTSHSHTSMISLAHYILCH